MGHLKHEIWLLTKAELSASIASIADFGLAIGLFYAQLLHYDAANIIGVVCGGITNGCINYRFVFKPSNRSKTTIAWRYTLVWLGSMLLNAGGTNAITSLLGPSYFIIVKSVIAFIVALAFNYPLQRYFVFKGRHSSNPSNNNTSPDYHTVTEEKDLSPTSHSANF